MNSIGKSKRNYCTKNQKLKILAELDSGNITCSELARKHGIHPMTIHKWKRAMKNENTDEIDVEELIKENKEVLKVNEFLKKALANMALKIEILQTTNDVLKKLK